MDRLRQDFEPLREFFSSFGQVLGDMVRTGTEFLGPWRWALWALLVLAAFGIGAYRAAGKSKKYRLSMSGGTDGSGATLFRSASGITRAPGWMNPFYGRPGIYRALPDPLAVLLFAWWVESPGSLSVAWRLAVVALVVMWIARRRVRQLRKRFVRPIFYSVARFLELDPRVERPHKWVKVPAGLFSGDMLPDESDTATIRESVLLIWVRAAAKWSFAWSEDYQQRAGVRWAQLRDRWWEVWSAIYPNADRVVVKLPESFAGVENGKKLVAEVVKTRIPGSWDAHWLLTEGPKSRVYFVRSKKAPKKVNLAELYNRTDVMEVRDYFRPPIGMDLDHKVVRLDMKGKQPHMLISAPTGWGKTTTGLLVITWFYINGAIIDIVDPKQTEFLFLEGHEGITVHNDDYRMSQVVTEFLEDLKFRQNWAKNKGIQPDELPEDLFPPRLLVIDEMGSFIRILKDMWREEGEKGEPRSFSHLMQILWRGRAFKMHLLTMAQQANARVLIDSDARDNYGYKVAAGPQSLSSWRMMFGNVPKPRIASRKGAAILGDGPDDLTDLQLAYVSQREVPHFLNMRDPMFPTTGYDQTRGVHPGTGPGRPAKVLSVVPGHGTPVLASENVEETAPEAALERPLRVLPGGLRDKLRAMEEAPENSEIGPVEPSKEEKPERLIIGNNKGVEFINTLSPNPRMLSWFIKTKQRHPIDGQITVEGYPAWTEGMLRAWYSERTSKAGRARAAHNSKQTG